MIGQERGPCPKCGNGLPDLRIDGYVTTIYQWTKTTCLKCGYQWGPWVDRAMTTQGMITEETFALAKEAYLREMAEQKTGSIDARLRAFVAAIAPDLLAAGMEKAKQVALDNRPFYDDHWYQMIEAIDEEIDAIRASVAKIRNPKLPTPTNGDDNDDA